MYEINTESNKLEPRLRVLVNTALPQAEVEAGMDGEVTMENEQEGMKDNVKVMELPVPAELEGGQEHSPPSESSPEGGQLEEGVPNTGSEAEIQSPGTLSSSGNVESEPIILPPPSCVLSLPGYVPKSLPDLNIHIYASNPDTLPVNRYPSTLLSSQKEVVIPLHSDTAFFQLLMEALQTLSTQLGAVADEFIENLHELSRTIASTARPMSATSHSFAGHSSISNPATVRVPSAHPIIPFTGGKSDLYQWREIFQMYVDLEVFESHGERERGERSVEDVEERLEMFRKRLVERGYMDGKAMRLKESRDAVEKFVKLNVFILDLKKVRVCLVQQHHTRCLPLLYFDYSSNLQQRRLLARF